MPGYRYADDNASSHTSGPVTKWKAENGVISFKLPARSPDINIIENVWGVLQGKLYDRVDEIKDANDTWRLAQQIWYNLSQDFLGKLYGSLPGRLEKLYKARGGVFK
jgi:hypothetical protein